MYLVPFPGKRFVWLSATANSTIVSVSLLHFSHANAELTSGGLAPEAFKKAPGIFKCTCGENLPGISGLVERLVAQTVA